MCFYAVYVSFPHKMKEFEELTALWCWIGLNDLDGQWMWATGASWSNITGLCGLKPCFYQCLKFPLK